MQNKIIDLISGLNESALKVDGFDDSIIGIATINGTSVVAYSVELMVKTLMDRDGMTRHDAEEYIEFNIKGAMMGENSPAFVEVIDCDPRP